MAYNKLLKFAAKNAAGQLLAGFANNTRNCPLAGRYMPMMKSLTIALFSLALMTSWSSSANIDIEYQVTEVAGSNKNYGLSVIAPASDPEQLVPYWHRKAVKICGSKKYKASALIKKETQCGDAIKVTSTGEKCEVIPASVFGTLSCNGI